MSNTNTTLFNTSLTAATKVAVAQARLEDLEFNLKELEKDRTTVQTIFTQFQISGEPELFNSDTRTDLNLDDTVDQVLVFNYFSLLARTLLQSNSAETSKMIRDRFFIRSLMTDKLSADERRTLCSKYINLVAIHGHIIPPTTMQKFWLSITGFFRRFVARQPELV